MSLPSAPDRPAGTTPDRVAGGAVRRRPRGRALGLLVLVAVLGIAVVLSLALGTRDVPVDQVIGALFTPTGDEFAESAVRSRIPTTVTGVLVGAALGLGGALMQGISRNPLADPGLLGVNSGASVAVVLAMAFGLATTPLATLWFAFLGAAAAVAVVYGIAAASRSGATPLTLALAGAAVVAICTSIVSGVLIVDASTLDGFRHWQLGSLTAASGDALAQLAPFVAVGAVLALVLGGALNGLALGDDVAVALGQRVRLTRSLAAASVVLLCGAATALAGPIAFVGLAVPHAVRALVGADYRWVLPLSALAGAALLLVADVVGRLVARPTTLEVGIVTAFIGAPVFIALVRRRAVSA